MPHFQSQPQVEDKKPVDEVEEVKETPVVEVVKPVPEEPKKEDPKKREPRQIVDEIVEGKRRVTVVY